MADPYQIVALDPEDIEDEIKSPKLMALRAQGYRVVATLPVEMRGKPRLAFIMEPPDRQMAGALETLQPAVQQPGPWPWWMKLSAILFFFIPTLWLGMLFHAFLPILGR